MNPESFDDRWPRWSVRLPTMPQPAVVMRPRNNRRARGRPRNGRSRNDRSRNGRSERGRHRPRTRRRPANEERRSSGSRSPRTGGNRSPQADGRLSPRSRRDCSPSPDRARARDWRVRTQLIAALSAVGAGVAIATFGALQVQLGEPIRWIGSATIASEPTGGPPAVDSAIVRFPISIRTVAAMFHEWSVAVGAFVVLVTLVACWVGTLAAIHVAARVIARRE